MKKNKDYLVENKVDDLIKGIGEAGSCILCERIGCRAYCHEHPELDGCEETVLKWAEEEHTCDIYPRGTIVEYEEDKYRPNTRLGYYNGYVGQGLHRICVYKESVGNNELGHVYEVGKFKQIK